MEIYSCEVDKNGYNKIGVTELLTRIPQLEGQFIFISEKGPFCRPFCLNN